MPKFGSTLAWAIESSPAVLKSSEKDLAMGAVAADLTKTPVSSANRASLEDKETAAIFERVDKGWVHWSKQDKHFSYQIMTKIHQK